MDSFREDSELFYRPKRQKVSEDDYERLEETKPFNADQVPVQNASLIHRSNRSNVRRSQNKGKSCSICGKKFGKCFKLKKHLRKHELGSDAIGTHITAYINASSQNKGPSCPICGDEFKKPKPLRKHLQKWHKLGLEATEVHIIASIAAAKQANKPPSKKRKKKNKRKKNATDRMMMKCKFPHCKQMFLDAQDMRRHYGDVAFHAFSNHFYCMSSSCDLQFETLDEVDLHFRKIHQNREEVKEGLLLTTIENQLATLNLKQTGTSSLSNFE